MSRQAAGLALELIQHRYDPTVAPAHRHLYSVIQGLIVSGDLTAGVLLPPSRLLARSLDLSRHTVSTALDRLAAEGYLVGRAGSGTFVNPTFVALVASKPLALPRRDPRASGRGEQVGAQPRSPFGDLEGTAFRVGQPALDRFPHELWARTVGNAARRAPRSSLGYGPPLGDPDLREQVATYLRASRGLQCSAEQVMITGGAQAAMELALRVLVDHGDQVALEDPGYLGARLAAAAAGTRPVFVPVDDHGLVVDRLPAEVRLAVVTPTHQFPLGSTMSLERRLALLQWAERNDSWVIEDDYDSEYRFGDRAFDPIAALDGLGRVLYVGTFSKVMFPALRLGYLVLPTGLEDAFAAAQLASVVHRPALEQAALAHFMRDGHFFKHQRAVKLVYDERRAALLEGLAAGLGHLPVSAGSAGLHVCVHLPVDCDDTAISAAAAWQGVEVWPLSLHCAHAARSGLVLGYGATTSSDLVHGLAVLRRLIGPPG